MSQTNANDKEDGIEKALKYAEIGGKLFSFFVPAISQHNGDLLSELLYSAGNYAAVLRKFYHSGLLRSTIVKHTTVFVRKTLETFEVVIECCAYKLGSKQWKWKTILCLQLLKLAMRLYLTYSQSVVLDSAAGGGSVGASNSARLKLPATCTCGNHLCPNHTLLAETLHSARPLLHACLYVRHGNASWLPWLCAAFADVLSVSCVPSQSCLSPGQVACYWSRVRGLAAYVFRTPFHDKVTQALVSWLASRRLPGLRRLFGLLLTYLTYWRLYYFNMWG